MGTTPSGAERRRHPRVAKRLMIRYRGVAGMEIPDSADQVGAIHELSKGGLILKTKRGYGSGMILRLELPESAIGPARRLHGRVVWGRPTEERDGFLLGMQFVKHEEAASKKKTTRRALTTTRYESADLGSEAERRTARVKERTSRAPGEERRKHPRWAQKILVKYRCVSKGVFHEVDHRVGMLLDFSRGGLVLTTLRDYPPGSIFEVLFPETAYGSARTVYAKILWTGPHDKAGQWRTGGHFVKAAAGGA